MSRRAVAFQNQLAVLALAGGLPATLVAVGFVWAHAPTPELRIVFIALLLSVWVGCALAVRRHVVFPLRTLANFVEGVRHGEFQQRARYVDPDDALGAVMQEVNSLGSILQQQRLASLDAIALVRSVLEELDVAVLAFDEQERLKLLNRAAAELLGRAPESLVGRSAEELGVLSLLRRPGREVVALTFPSRSGRFEVHRRTFRDGGLPHALMVISDLSHALREEERRSWERLIRVIGHEINNSLAPIKSVAESLHDILAKDLPCDSRRPQAADAGEPVDRQDMLEGLNLIADRATALSRFVRTYSHLARLPPLVKSVVSLNTLLQRLVALQGFAGVQLVAPYQVRIHADAGQLEQAVINVLRNALEAASEAQHGAAACVEIVLSRTGDAAIIEIRDNGPGIANADNLFVPFFTTKAGGSGIGLAISRQIIENHGGSLTLDQRRDRCGCVARLALPGVVPDRAQHPGAA